MYNDLFKPTHLQKLCQECSLNPSKKYGQNYLITEAPIKKMLEVAKIKKTDTILEIGPGFGVLTLALVKEAKKVIAFEIERKLENYWQEKIVNKKLNNLEIIYGNALNKIQDISNKIQQYKVVANLPYQITSNILRKILELENKPESITIMVQKEVAERICAKPGEMSVLAISVQYFAEPIIITKVSRGSFWPSPKVDSAVLYIKIKNQKNKKSEKSEIDLFFRVMKAGFANKRKQLWRNLSEGLQLDKDKVKNILKNKVGNEMIRAEELSVAQWKKIINNLDIK
ncbi:MAG TPA: 16S rRNA (adenine(1518)-N(6)/adenine(1519)-N(6))-dimethyltransferase RsmA [Candidatus Magasanikbacteria bacterium]|jgi:16S rRNA (adenine1518-N6/adenine1519-N6)-dimethyltransferase|nr:ribosomal RNA small subunit methyltransferase A [Candidatus Magasanikbacteria bacterium]HQF57026.1 16S rRNA (adenine(1518)-N(6)/adenine(1519)-N(6))-dimethyltransferase RsmA [Candidatus Magasanikbacteria bacterium]HQL52943.1 16S rRNA (adenine(1518)-N(6)/adenine(1519)-N(6))-dimethyltransferase RsmA [Candidatus Magasanikbacteria bacterium]